MADYTSGFNVATYVSWHHQLFSLCDLTKEDVFAALSLPGVCKSEDEIQAHFKTMKVYYNGYNFAELRKVPHVFNTNTCLKYLQMVSMLSQPIKLIVYLNSFQWETERTAI
ncbi:hypothetical protein BGW38_008636 [Lunasporangiospora selenospora]|uniref:Uncharacterized protein n=1 Tax=Lunasporangiospora selenospora TaxID=979761 RepID=A0A9P6G369_9FUNG|nr:hypothetical protein BGW38_008636 [Lunasporangiospora selenospora]